MQATHNKKETVFVGLSGGVDSSVSAFLLKQEGYNVVGVYIRTWQPKWLQPCTWRDDRRDAMRVAAHLDIPFLECDMVDRYKNAVAGYMIEEYKKGRTPNPDVMCNKEVKFGGFLEWAKERGADYVATGHYARIEKEGKRVRLKRGKDPKKDQSYFLWTLTEKELEHIMFPVGGMVKTGVRAIAQKAGLPTQARKDSQGICFLGDVDMKEFLKHEIEGEYIQKGDVLSPQGDVIGEHDGALLYTLGERHGFQVYDKKTYSTPLYVIGKDIQKNTITVGPETINQNKDTKQVFSLRNVTINGTSGEDYEVQYRYQGKRYAATMISKDEIAIHGAPNDIALGQSVVVYRGDICYGGAILDQRKES